MITEDELITQEIYFEKQKIEDKSVDSYRSLLLKIKHYLEQGKSLRKIKKAIQTSSVNKDMEHHFKKMVDEQLANITDNKVKADLDQESLAGYTLKESVQARQLATKKQALGFMAIANETLKEKKSVNDLIDKEVEKYGKQLEAFYRTQTKKAREQGYLYNDKKDNKNIRGWISIAVLDNRTSPICISYHNKVYLKKDYKTREDIPNRPPRHINCRSILMPVYDGVRITNYKGQNISTFLKNNPKVAEDILGQKKYRIFKSGKAKINSFIDVKGQRFFTNDEIIKRLGIKNKNRLNKIGGKKL